MKKSLLLPALLAVAGIGLASTASAQLIAYNSTGYVTANQNNARTYNLAGSTATVSFSDSSALSPSSGYTGPAFYGAASMSLTGAGTTTLSAVTSNVQNDASGYDRINLVGSLTNSDAAAKTLSAAALIYFKTGSSFDVSANNAFSTSTLNNLSGSTSATGRWLVRDSGGSLYVSNETFTLGTSVATSTGLTTTTWALLNTSGSDFYQTYGSFGSLSLTGLTGAGVYADAQRTGITSVGATGAGFRLNEFTVIPEPTTAVMLLGGLGALMLLRRRRHMG